jgi:hypothetical protein
MRSRPRNEISFNRNNGRYQMSDYSGPVTLIATIGQKTHIHCRAALLLFDLAGKFDNLDPHLFQLGIQPYGTPKGFEGRNQVAQPQIGLSD